MDARRRVALHLPESAAKGATAEAKAAYQSRPFAEWEALVRQLRPEVEKVRAQVPAQKTAAAPAGLSSRALGAPEPLGAQSFQQGPGPRPRTTPVDGDMDHVPDALEEALWQSYVPRYFLSAGEQNNFAFFANSFETVITGTQATPPIGYYSVRPLFLGSKGGVTYGFAQINFATFWDHDGGLFVDANCRRHATVALALIGIDFYTVIGELGGHKYDEEHSAALVAGPLANGQYNPDPNAYRMYMFYTAAHENTKTDHSHHYLVNPPRPPGAHVRLYLSRSKHATYVFPPEGFPIAPSSWIYTYFWIVELLFLAGRISPHVYLTLLYFGEAAFFECFVEHFEKRDDGVYPSPAINVGEPGRPLNGAAWAGNDQFRKKLEPRWNSRILRFLGFRYAGVIGGGNPDPDPPDRDPPDRDPIPRQR